MPHFPSNTQAFFGKVPMEPQLPHPLPQDLLPGPPSQQHSSQPQRPADAKTDQKTIVPPWAHEYHWQEAARTQPHLYGAVGDWAGMATMMMAQNMDGRQLPPPQQQPPQQQQRQQQPSPSSSCTTTTPSQPPTHMSVTAAEAQAPGACSPHIFSGSAAPFGSFSCSPLTPAVTLTPAAIFDQEHHDKEHPDQQPSPPPQRQHQLSSPATDSPGRYRACPDGHDNPGSEIGSREAAAAAAAVDCASVADMLSAGVAMTSAHTEGGAATPPVGEQPATRAELETIKAQMQVLVRAQLDMHARLAAQLDRQDQAQLAIDGMLSTIKAWVLSNGQEAKDREQREQQQRQQDLESRLHAVERAVWPYDVPSMSQGLIQQQNTLRTVAMQVEQQKQLLDHVRAQQRNCLEVRLKSVEAAVKGHASHNTATTGTGASSGH